MEFRQLRYFLAIVECGSVTKAAQKVYIAQSALSRQLADLEAELGVKLLLRNTNGVSPTVEGLAFYDHARLIVRQIAQARMAVTQCAASFTGTLSLALPQSVAQVLALPLLKAVRARLPGLQFKLQEERCSQILPQLCDGVVDLAILTSNAVSDDVVFEPILDEELVLVHAPGIGPDLPFELPLAQALRQPQLLMGGPQELCVRAVVQCCARNANLAWPEFDGEADSHVVLIGAARAGMACTIVPAASVGPDIIAGHLIAHALVEPPVRRILGLCSHGMTPMNTGKRLLFDLVREVLSAQCRAGLWYGMRPVDAGLALPEVPLRTGTG